MPQDPPLGRRLPDVRGPVPGPGSRALAGRLARVESRNVTHIADDWPVFWSRAAGANVEDVDGNVYVDLTAGFGVAATGHAHPDVAAAIAEQAARLPHALGDVHPAAVKVELLERLASLMPGPLDVTVLGGAGAEAVEAALKTATLATGRPGVLAFRGGYHGLTLGALAATDRPESREPFAAQLFAGVRFAPYPSRPRLGGADVAASCDAALDQARRAIRASRSEPNPVGAVLVEPIQGRGGIVVPPADFLPGLRSICDDEDVVLVVDEIYAGLGRTGRWLASEHVGVVPDVVTIGKALTGALQLSAAIGTREVMDAWPASTGEAIHTSTFLGNPVACAAALAQLDVLERDRLPERAERLGAELHRRLEGWMEIDGVVDARGVGLLRGVELASRSGEPDGARAWEVVRRALGEGILMLAEGPAGNVLAFVPPLVIGADQLEHAAGVVERLLREVGRSD